MIPCQNNKFVQGVMLCDCIRLLVSINNSNWKSSHHFCLHCVGHRAGLEAHGLSDSEVLLDWVYGNPFIPGNALELQCCFPFLKAESWNNNGYKKIS